MPRISNPKKLVSIQSRSPTPTNDQIAHLILDQKDPTQAIQTFKWASKLPNFTHSQSTYRALIHKLSTFRDFGTAHQLLDEMPHSINETPDESIFVTLVRGLGKAHMVKEAIKMVDLVSRYGRDRVTLKLLNSVLDVLVKEDIEIAREFYRRKMVNEFRFVGDDYTFGILMKGLCRTNRIGDGFKLLQAMKSKGVKPNTVIYNTLIHALCRNGKVGRARSFMHEMTEHNVITFNIMISAYCVEENENLIQALVLLDKCFKLGLLPDVITVTKLLELLCNKGRAMEGLEILERVESKGGVIDVVFYNTLIKGFCKLGKVKVGCRFLKEMERKGILPSVDTYNILISGFCDLGNLDSALDIFNDMKTSAVCGDFITHDTLIRGLCYGARIKEAYRILELMQESRKGSEGRISPYNSIIYGLYKENRIQEALDFLTKMENLFPRAVNRSVKIINFCEKGYLDDAKLVYAQLIAEGGDPNVLIYVCIIHTCCQKRHTREAFEMINEMVSRRLFPMALTFNVLISAFCKEGMVGSGLKLLEDMVGRGCLPDIESYRPLVDEFCSKDEFEKMIMVLEEMVENGIVPDYGIWCLMMNSWQSRDEMVNLVTSII